jgi:ABC-type transport system involved in cytochrome bd biosynthesis fused ATPase/permease subunit
MRLAWEGMIPCSLLVVVMTAVWVFLGWQDWMFAASLATILIVYLVHPFMPRQAEANDRIQMIGSRFNPVDEHDGQSANASTNMSLSD